MNEHARTLSLSVLSGKGGVGKTSLALNISYALYDANQDTLLVDCDLGLANLDVMLGISPEKSFHAVLKQDMPIRDSLCRLEKRGLDLIPSTSGIPDMLEFDEERQLLAIEKLNSLMRQYAFLVMDLGAGISRTVLSFARMTQYRLVVITPEPTSLTDAYAVIKVLAVRHGVKDFHIVMNMVQSEDEAVAGFERLRTACDTFLSLPVRYLGHVRRDGAVVESVRRQRALLRQTPDSPAAQDIRRIVNTLVDMRDGLDEQAAPALSLSR